MNRITTLAIDTSCDETSASVVDYLTVLSNIQPSQMEYHKKFGGVVPNLARLAHQERIDNVVDEALRKAKKSIEEIEFFAVTIGPGLAIALEVGILKAKELATKYNKPLITINHMEGHLLSCFAKPSTIATNRTDLAIVANSSVPALGLLVSGGHTEFIFTNKIGTYEKIGETLDDSCGECLDKCGRILGLGYPAGPIISKFAKEHRRKVKLSLERRNASLYISAENKETGSKYELPVGMAFTNDLNVSYSGLKTAFRSLVETIITQNTNSFSSQAENKLQQDIETAKRLTKIQILDLCVLVEAAAYKPLEIKLEKFLSGMEKGDHKSVNKSYKVKEVWLGGGVVASARLRHLIRKIAKKYEVKFRFPYTKKLTTDNAAMIGVAANFRIYRNYNVLNKLKYSQSDLKFLLQQGIYISSKEFITIDRDPGLELK
ncbi:MAG: tRNA (adenosine(37)-N6)-threonylcarbamoyltransferase complex transferase subunit TsaD [Candidatus Dojkabacteria bacterium]